MKLYTIEDGKVKGWTRRALGKSLGLTDGQLCRRLYTLGYGETSLDVKGTTVYTVDPSAKKDPKPIKHPRSTALLGFGYCRHRLG